MIVILVVSFGVEYRYLYAFNTDLRIWSEAKQQRLQDFQWLNWWLHNAGIKSEQINEVERKLVSINFDTPASLKLLTEKDLAHFSAGHRALILSARQKHVCIYAATVLVVKIYMYMHMVMLCSKFNGMDS